MLAIVLSVPLRFADSNYPFGTFKLCLIIFIYCEQLMFVDQYLKVDVYILKTLGKTEEAIKNIRFWHVYQLLADSRWFSPGTPEYSTTQTGRHDIAEILLKVALSTINQSSMHSQTVFISYIITPGRACCLLNWLYLLNMCIIRHVCIIPAACQKMF